VSEALRVRGQRSRLPQATLSSEIKVQDCAFTTAKRARVDIDAYETSPGRGDALRGELCVRR
jgi:hypothetical protein